MTKQKKREALRLDNISKNMGRYNILGVNFNLVSYREVFNNIADWKQDGKCEIITITNPHSVLMCHRDKCMRIATSNAKLTLPDGAGIILAANMLAYKHNGRVTGPQLMLKVCDWGRKMGIRHFFYGGLPGIAEKLSDNLKQKYPGLKVAGTYCPPFRELSEKEDLDIIKYINKTKPDIVWVGLGAPKQEKWMISHKNYIQVTCLIGVGAAFDFHSDNVKWAPYVVRKMGMEWAWRLILEPRRMWRRNLDSPLFIIKVILQKMGLRNYLDC